MVFIPACCIRLVCCDFQNIVRRQISWHHPINHAIRHTAEGCGSVFNQRTRTLDLSYRRRVSVEPARNQTKCLVCEWGWRHSRCWLHAVGQFTVELQLGKRQWGEWSEGGQQFNQQLTINGQREQRVGVVMMSQSTAMCEHVQKPNINRPFTEHNNSTLTTVSTRFRHTIPEYNISFFSDVLYLTWLWYNLYLLPRKLFSIF